MIQKQVENHNISLFKTVEISDIEIEMNNINANKAETNNSIPPKILKKSSKVSASAFHKQFNDSIEKSEFPQNLDLADIAHIYKKNDTLYKVKPVVSNIFKIIMQKQINGFVISFLSSYLCGYRKGF